MSNHYHVVLHVDQARAQGWSGDEVVERWEQLYRLPSLVLGWQKARDTLGKAELAVVLDTRNCYNRFFADIHYSRALNVRPGQAIPPPLVTPSKGVEKPNAMG